MANNPIVVMYPDYRGESTRNSFLPDQIRAYLPQAAIIPVFNGATVAGLDFLVTESHALGLDGIKSEQPGLASALMTGYRHCLDRYLGATVVLLDTSEHDVRYLSTLVDRATEMGGLVIGNLSFEPETLEEGSLDELMHLELFPQLYDTFAGISLSGTHGYQAVSPTVFGEIYKSACRIMDQVVRNIAQVPTWGFDGAMVLSAVNQGIPVTVTPIPAQARRSRSKEKILAQYKQALQVCRAAERLFQCVY